ncbi:hypothetical protein M9H77_12524 [Catharanthus roseus]|uniref:Uncharacterized protein n=1 Tax=Catharanthus roseus TaxID=4058 RepID=A0ACC0BHN2_CATRO|nr:hypothetical protein M9H77_12524 [Catharanthus roseus]
MGRGHMRKYAGDAGIFMEPTGASALSTPTQPAAPVPLVPTSQISPLSTPQTSPPLKAPTTSSPPTKQPTTTLTPSMAPTTSTLTAHPTAPSVAPEMTPPTWKLLFHDSWEVLELNVDLPSRTRRTRIRDGGRRPIKHTGGFISFTKSLVKKQAVLAERFSRSKELEELHKDRKEEKKRGKKFYKIKKKAKEEVAVTVTTIPDDLHLMTIAAGGMTRSNLYGASSEATHLRVKSNHTPSCRGLALIRPCYAHAEQRMLQRWRLLFRASPLGVVASACKEFQELRLFPSDLHGVGYAAVTEEGLVAISIGWYNCSIQLVCCLQLQSFDVKLIDVNKTCKVTKGGPVMKYAAMLVYGNYHGVVGYAKAKGPAIPIALQKVGINGANVDVDSLRSGASGAQVNWKNIAKVPLKTLISSGRWSYDKEDTGNIDNDMVEESHVRKIKKDAYYVASFDGPGLIITTFQLKENDKDNNYAKWAKAMRLALPAVVLSLLEEREDTTRTEVGLLMAECLLEVNRDRDRRCRQENVKKMAGSLLRRSGGKERLRPKAAAPAAQIPRLPFQI